MKLLTKEVKMRATAKTSMAQSGLMLSPITTPAQWECTHNISPMPHLAQTGN